jgi:NAD(P)H dehydrogenase (quinone)
MKINVMGAGGQLGHKVMEALLREGTQAEDLIASVRTSSKAQDLAEKDISVRHADYEEPQTLREAFRGTDVLLLIPSTALVEPRILQHFNALEAAREAGVKRVVFVSFVAAEPASKFLIAPFFLYAESKMRLSGLPWTILRDGMYLDPVADWVPHLVKTERLPYPVREGRVAYISRDDLARAIAAVCLTDGHSGAVYELTGREAVSMPRLAAAISAASGTPVAYQQVSEEEFASVCRAGGDPEPLVQILLSMYRAVDAGEFERATDHVERLTGTPPETVETYLKRAVRLS